jgi:NAD(P)H-nitrite reductase large subunit
VEYVIVGNSVAAVGAVEGIRSVDQEGKITLISKEPYHTYSRPLISYYLAGKVTAEKMFYRPLDFYERNRVRALLGKEAVALDAVNKVLTVRDPRDDSVQEIAFDKLLLATGSKPFLPPIDGLDKKKVFTFLSFDDVRAISSVAVPGARAVVIGGGLIGLKAAEALTTIGVQVTVVELGSWILNTILDQHAALIVQNHLEKQGIRFLLQTTCEEVLGNDEVEAVKLNNGATLNCDFVVIAVGVRPNTELVQGTLLKVNKGVVVDQRMQTNLPDIYAAGDVAEGYDLISGKRRVLPILPNAYKQGKTAGINMAGGEKEFPGGFPMNSIGFFGLSINTAGLIEPGGDCWEVLVKEDQRRQVYKKIILHQDRIVGFIILNEIDRSGILTGLMSERVSVADFKESLLETPGLVNLPDGLRHARQFGGAQ